MASDIYTQAGEEFVIDALDTALTAPYIGCGTGTTNASKSDTALVTQVGSRVAGTKSQPAADKLQVVGTVSFSGSYAITEAGLFTASAGGTMLQRHTFDAINVSNGDSIQFTITHEQA